MAQPYRTVQIVFANKGLVARYSEDRLPDPSQYLNLDNLECRQENALSSRYGLKSITHTSASAPLPAAVHSLGRLKSLAGATDRLAGAGQKIYKLSGDSPGSYTDITGGFTMSGSGWSQVVYTPEMSANPYAFIFDSAANVKYAHGLSSVLPIGIAPPTVPAMLVLFGAGAPWYGYPQWYLIDPFTSASGYTLSNLTSASIQEGAGSSLHGAVLAGNLWFTSHGAHTGVMTGMIVSLDSGASQEYIEVGHAIAGATDTYIRGVVSKGHADGTLWTWDYLQASIASSTTGTVTSSAGGAGLNLDLSVVNGVPMSAADVFTLAFQSSVAANISSVSIKFSVGDATFANCYSGTFSLAGLTDGVFRFLALARSAFTATGLAGMAGYDWSNVQAWQIIVTTTSGGGATIGFGDLYLSVGTMPTVTGGVPYDYRHTYYDANTGAESNPSVPLIPARYVSPTNQSVVVVWQPSSDTSVTHVRLYRRGGSLPSAWYQLAQIPVGTNIYLDSFPDADIVNNNQAELDNDQPVTSTLVTPVNATLTSPATNGMYPTYNSPCTVTYSPASPAVVAGQLVTVDTGGAQEQVYVQSVGSGSFTAVFQRPHAVGTAVTATTAPNLGLNLACVAFETLWAAGDLNNPSTVYYSKAYNVEAWPPQNTLVVGPPSDPITGVVFYRGQLYVFTLANIYQIIAGGGQTPFALVTGTIHGLFANFGWAAAEGELVYKSVDGAYAFSGSSMLLSEIIDWIMTGQQDTGVSSVVSPIATGSGSSVRAAFCGNEVFFSYLGADSAYHRVIYHTVYRRWRNDDVAATAMLYESDTGTLVVGEASGGIYIDRQQVDYDDGGWSGGVETHAPITINLQTQLLDFGNIKAEKVFTELTLDVDTGNQNLTVNLFYDSLASAGDTFTVKTNGRQQVQLNINNGLGWRARRLSVQITGGVTAVVTLYQMDIRIALEAENRQSWDTYQMPLAGGEYAIVKQGYFVYEAPNGPISVNVLLEGSDSAAFSFILPQTAATSDATTNTLSRSSLKVRFPAWKAKIWRLVGTCSGDFKLLADSFLETKPITGEKGYGRHRLAEAAQT